MFIFLKFKHEAFSVAVAVLLLLQAPSALSFADVPSTRAPPKIGEAGEDEIGFALAGGGLRAASACYGVLRGFQQKNVTHPDSGEQVSAMDLVAYNSAISGSAIPAMLYAYARVSTQELLETDRTTDPSKITEDELSRMPKTSMGYVIACKPDWRNILFRAIKKQLINPLNLLKVHSFWNAGFYKKFCEPLNIPKNKYFTSSKGELDKILQENPKFKESDFLLPRDDVKTSTMLLITMHGSRADGNKYMRKFQEILDKAWEEYKAQETLAYFTNSFEMRPNMTEIVLSIRDKYGANIPMPYVITPDCVENKYSGTVQVRKNKVDFPENNVRPFEWGTERGRYGRKRRFSVETWASMSTNFVGSTTKVLDQLITGLRTIPLSDGSAVTQKFADGGTSDLMGIMPLVARGTKNIICSYIFNQNPPIIFFNKTYADIYRVANATSLEDPDFDAHFREWLTHMNPRITSLFGFFNVFPIARRAYIMDHVFLDPNIDRLKELMIKYNALFKAGEPLIATLKDLEVIDNPFWSIKGGKKINLTLMYFNMPKKFSENVPEDAVPPPEGHHKIDEDGRFTNEEFKVVPELSVDGIFDQLLYTCPQINMMGYLGSWMVDHSWDGLIGPNGEEVFEGFGKIFGKKEINSSR